MYIQCASIYSVYKYKHIFLSFISSLFYFFSNFDVIFFVGLRSRYSLYERIPCIQTMNTYTQHDITNRKNVCNNNSNRVKMKIESLFSKCYVYIGNENENEWGKTRCKKRKCYNGNIIHWKWQKKCDVRIWKGKWNQMNDLEIL